MIATKSHKGRIVPAIRDIDNSDKTLLRIAKYSDCGVISTALIRLRSETGRSFADFERRLRELGTDTFLLAVERHYNIEPSHVPFDFHTRRERPYWIWICVSQEDYDHAIDDFEIQSVEINLIRLVEAGFLMVRNNKPI